MPTQRHAGSCCWRAQPLSVPCLLCGMPALPFHLLFGTRCGLLLVRRLRHLALETVVAPALDGSGEARTAAQTLPGGAAGLARRVARGTFVCWLALPAMGDEPRAVQLQRRSAAGSTLGPRLRPTECRRVAPWRWRWRWRWRPPDALFRGRLAQRAARARRGVPRALRRHARHARGAAVTPRGAATVGERANAPAALGRRRQAGQLPGPRLHAGVPRGLRRRAVRRERRRHGPGCTPHLQQLQLRQQLQQPDGLLRARWHARPRLRRGRAARGGATARLARGALGGRDHHERGAAPLAAGAVPLPRREASP